MTTSNVTSNNTNKSWLEWLTYRESGVLIDQSNQEGLFAAFNANISKTDCIKAVLKHNKTVFLQKTESKLW